MHRKINFIKARAHTLGNIQVREDSREACKHACMRSGTRAI